MSRNKKMEESIKNEVTKSKTKAKETGNFKFQLHTIVKYVGKLFDDLTGKEAEVLTRSHSKGRINYDLKFLHDGKVRSFMETVLVAVPMQGQISIEEYEKENK
jgi:hypothetical protein